MILIGKIVGPHGIKGTVKVKPFTDFLERFDKEKIIKMVDEYASMHQERLITGFFGVKASYLYLSLLGSFKTVAKELVDFSQMV